MGGILCLNQNYFVVVSSDENISYYDIILLVIHMIEANINNISKTFGADLIFENISFDIKTNERIGLIGPNGSGKTTIIKILYGLDNVQQGSISFRKGSKLGCLDQIPDYEDDMVDVDGDGIDDNTAGNDDFGDRFESSGLLKPTQTGTYIVPNLYSNNVKNNEISDLFVFKSLSTKPFNEFYMSCRFFNAKTGDVVRMTNDPLIDSGINPKKDFYYKVKLNRQKLTYEIYDYSDGVEGERVGDSDDNPLMFYQML